MMTDTQKQDRVGMNSWTMEDVFVIKAAEGDRLNSPQLGHVIAAFVVRAAMMNECTCGKCRPGPWAFLWTWH